MAKHWLFDREETEVEARFRKHACGVVDEAAGMVDRKLAEYLWKAAKRATQLGIDYEKLQTMWDLALDVAPDMPHLPAQVACCEVGDVLKD
jgi:hypothetical protein